MKARVPGMPNGGNSQANMMKKIQEMQAQLETKQAEVEASEFSASAGGSAVSVTVTGAHEIKAIDLKPEIVDPDDIEMLSDLIIAAANEAMKKADDAMEQAMGALKGGLGLGF
ncbi:MAG: YbaB/EbfC family nucleoid-associated protein [Acutalibacteraceae bacterium]